MKLKLAAVLVFALGANAYAVKGNITGTAAPQMRISCWLVKSSGQPLQELTSSAIKDGAFEMELPSTAPNSSAFVAIDSRIDWPGLIEFQKSSVAANSAEAKFFVYKDINANGQHDDNEPLREVPVGVGKSFLFVVWADKDVTVSGSNSYSAVLNKGWNAMTVDVRSSVGVKTFDPKNEISVSLGK